MSSHHPPTPPVTRPQWARIVAAAVMNTLLVSALIQGCTAQQPSCTFDSECHVDARCVQGGCYQECLSDEACERYNMGQACVTVERGSTSAQQFSVCGPTELSRSATGANAMTMDCADDAFCQEVFRDTRARCGLLSSCIIPPEEHALLLFTSTAQEVELVSIYLEDRDDSYLGPLSIDLYSTTTTEEAPETWNHPGPWTCDMFTSDLEGLHLPGQEEGFVRLGLTLDGERVTFEEGWRVVLVERADVCQSEPVEVILDHVEVMLCVGIAGDTFNRDEQCTRKLPLTRRQTEEPPYKEAIINFAR